MTEEDCEALVRNSNDNSLVPYFFLHAFCPGQRYPQEADQLYAECAALPTAKNRYIFSVLEGNRIRNRGKRNNRGAT
jgi:hypothetical protein